MIKLIVTDIDGTILKHNFEFNQEVKDCIKKLTQAGIKVVLATGRMHAAAEHIAKELNLITPIVSYQGGLIKHKNKILYEKNLNSQYATEIIQWAKANKIHLNLYMNDKLYVEEDNPVIRRYTGEQKIKGFVVESFNEIEITKVNKLLAIDFEDENKVTKWEKYLSTKYKDVHVVKSTPYFCEVCHQDAKKSDAVNFLKEYWQLERKEIMTIGDQNNDIELLLAGGIKVAMGNATEELKSIADYITDTVSNNGFVKAVEKFIRGYDEAKL
jgi:Cof subfamily protein (haloacid dehalogenase superfamily)